MRPIPYLWPVTFSPLPTFFFFFLTCASEDTDGSNQRSFTLGDVFNNTLKPRSYNLRWISGGRKWALTVALITDRCVWLLNCESVWDLRTPYCPLFWLLIHWWLIPWFQSHLCVRSYTWVIWNLVGAKHMLVPDLWGYNYTQINAGYSCWSALRKALSQYKCMWLVLFDSGLITVNSQSHHTLKVQCVNLLAKIGYRMDHCDIYYRHSWSHYTFN